MQPAATELDLWNKVTDMLGDGQKALGRQWSSDLRRNPARLSAVLSCCKFAAKMTCRGRTVLELACGEGLGSPILGEFATSYLGVDADRAAIAAAEASWKTPRREFRATEWLGQRLGTFETVLCLDIGAQLVACAEQRLLDTMLANLAPGGLCLAAAATRPASKQGDGSAGQLKSNHLDRLAAWFEGAFRRTLRFAMSDGMMHTEFQPASQYVLCLGVCPREPRR